MESKICPRCKGNGFFKVKESVERQVDVVVQCPMCNSEGEVRDKEFWFLQDLRNAGLGFHVGYESKSDLNHKKELIDENLKVMSKNLESIKKQSTELNTSINENYNHFRRK